MGKKSVRGKRGPGLVRCCDVQVKKDSWAPTRHLVMRFTRMSRGIMVLLQGLEARNDGFTASDPQWSLLTCSHNDSWYASCYDH